jgi:hypothetical protein
LPDDCRGHDLPLRRVYDVDARLSRHSCANGGALFRWLPSWQGQPLGYLRREFVLPGLPKQTVSFVLAEMTRLHHVAVELLGQAEPHTSEIAAALAASRKAELPMVLPMRISQLCSGALGPNS